MICWGGGFDFSQLKQELGNLKIESEDPDIWKKNNAKLIYQRESQNSYYNNLKGLFPLSKIKKVLKKITPNRLISFRQDLARIKVLRNDVKLNWFVNNTGDNCYIRGILRKN